MEKCKCCNRDRGKNDLRMGFCFNCVESESIIQEGVDMYDKEIPQTDGFTKGMSKLRHILRKYKKN